MNNDPIIEEVRGFRREHAERFGHDLQPIVEDLRKKEQASQHEQISPGPKVRMDRKAG